MRSKAPLRSEFYYKEDDEIIERKQKKAKKLVRLYWRFVLVWKIFHVSCETGFGIDALKEFLIQKGHLRPWRYHPQQVSTFSEVQKAEQAIKQAIMEKFF